MIKRVVSLIPMLTLTSLSTLSTTAHADQVFSEALIVIDDLMCVGSDCADLEIDITGRDGLKIKDSRPTVFFDDTSGGSSPKNDWSLNANENLVGGIEGFFLSDDTNSTRPITVLAGAPDSTLFIANDGDIGLGTALPQTEVHVVGGIDTIARLETTTDAWDLTASEDFFWLRQVNTNTYPFVIQGGAPNRTFTLTSSGNVGVGTDTPDAPFEVSSTGSFNFFRISAASAAVNQSVDITFTGGPLGTGQLRYNIVDGDAQEMSLDADGNMVLDGTLTTAGPTCAAGCDRVFDPGYTLLSISERSSLTLAQGHLPALGPTVPGAPVNVTEKLAGVINELEHAHLYIDQLHGDMTRLQQDRQTDMALIQTLQATQSELLARLNALEAN